MRNAHAFVSSVITIVLLFPNILVSQKNFDRSTPVFVCLPVCMSVFLSALTVSLDASVRAQECLSDTSELFFKMLNVVL